MEEKKITNFTVPILVVLLAVAAFLAGSFFTRIQYLEKKPGTAQVSPTPEAAGQPTPVVLGEEEIAKLVETGQVKGEETAKVTMVEFSDFQCPFCARYAKETFPQIEKEYIKTGKVRYIFHHYPLSFHQYAQKAAEAAECAGEQGKFWEMHDKIFANQEKITVADLKKYAQTLELPLADFNSCLDSDKYKNKVQGDVSLGGSVGVSGTPAFFINGRLVSGALPYENFKVIIEEELGK
ncbi:MAG: DsbA family protein [Patescibacteria group bacterium]